MKEVRYFYVPNAAQETELPQEEATHALRVLRLKAGDEIFLMDGEGAFIVPGVIGYQQALHLRDPRVHAPTACLAGTYPLGYCPYQDDGPHRMDDGEGYGDRI